MLRSLYIKNFILVDELSLEFNDGFNVFTGETGAGKSIIIDAISLLSRKKANASYLKDNSKSALIEAVFDVDFTMANILNDALIDYDDSIVISREIKVDGKSVYRFNNRIVNGILVNDLLKDIIDIHSQHDNQYLLNKNKHIDLLDKFIDTSLLESLKESYQKYFQLNKELASNLDEKYNDNDLDYLNFVIDEIEKANLNVNEEEDLLQIEQKYNLIKDNLSNYQEIKNLYDDYIYPHLYEVIKLIRNFKNPQFEEVLNEASINIEDVINELTRLVNSYEVDEDTINNVQARLYQISRLKNKYGKDIKAVLQTLNDAKKRVDMINNRQEYLDAKQKEVDLAYAEFEKIAMVVHEKRCREALKLENRIIENLSDLMLDKARFKIDIQPTNASSKGLDSVEFLISLNPGMDLAPLQKIASGGELSRLMLGLKTIFTSVTNIKTIIFDEIDTGVSGKAASAIGNKMKLLSHTTQVFAITHLPIVASYADDQYKVYKEIIDDITVSNIHKLNAEERLQELALMTSGEINNQSLNVAKSLLEKNHG